MNRRTFNLFLAFSWLLPTRLLKAQSVNTVAKEKIRAVSFYVERDTGEVAHAEITDKQYSDLALRGASEPQPRPQLPDGNWQWQYAIGGSPKFNTTTGFLNVKDYFPGDKETPAMFVTDKGEMLLGEKATIEANK